MLRKQMFSVVRSTPSRVDQDQWNDVCVADGFASRKEAEQSEAYRSAVELAASVCDVDVWVKQY